MNADTWKVTIIAIGIAVGSVVLLAIFRHVLPRLLKD